MRLTPKNELEYRFRKLQVEMHRAGLDAVILQQNADLFYFTGTVQGGALYVPSAGDPLFFVERDFLRARMESALKEVHPCDGLEAVPLLVSQFGHPSPFRIGLELDVMPVNRYERIRSIFPAASFSDASGLVRRVRMVKTHYEIHILQDAGGQADKVYRLACETLRPGISEVELAAELERLARREGHQGYVRVREFNRELHFGRVLSGTDAATPSAAGTVLGGMGLTPAFGQGASYRRIAANEPVAVDFAACFDGYVVEQTRVLSIGEPSERIRRGYDDMLSLQALAMELAGQGESWEGIWRAAVKEAERLGHSESFLGPPVARTPWLGHGVGIEMDEYPLLGPGFSQERVETGMVFTLEPMLVFPGEGAVGIKNTFYLSEEGLKCLTFSSEELLIV